jgi:hypothetical protein
MQTSRGVIRWKLYYTNINKENNMKKLIATTATLLLAASGAQALLVGFGEDYIDGTITPDYGVNYAEIDPGVSQTMTYETTDTVNDITFTLGFTVANSSLTGNITSRGTAEDIVVAGGTSNIRIDSGTNLADASDDEGIRITLALSGAGVANLTSLSMDNLVIRRWGDGETTTFHDGVEATGNSIAIAANGALFADAVSYDGSVGAELTGLTALALANVDTWGLEVWAHDDHGDDGVALGSIGFEYTVIPEPATLGMVVAMGGAMLWIRRKFTI